MFEAFVILAALGLLSVAGSSYPVAVWVGVVLAVGVSLPGIYSLIIGPPFKPTTQRKISAALALGQVGPGKIIYDLGCGDGRFLHATAQCGARAIGYELSLPMYLLAKVLCAFHPNTRVRFGNFWEQAYDDADVIYCFLVPSVMQRFHDEIWPRLPAGCRILSNTFPIPGLSAMTEHEGVLLYKKSPTVAMSVLPYISPHSAPQSPTNRILVSAPLPQKQVSPVTPGP